MHFLISSLFCKAESFSHQMDCCFGESVPSLAWLSRIGPSLGLGTLDAVVGLQVVPQGRILEKCLGQVKDLTRLAATMLVG